MTPSDPPSIPTRYRLKFLPEALAEWNALDGSVKEVLKKLLRKRLEHPRLPGPNFTAISARLLQDQAAQAGLSAGLPGRR